MDKILHELGIEYFYYPKTGKYYYVDSTMDDTETSFDLNVYGSMYIMDGFVYFEHGNAEYGYEVDDPQIKDAIDAYAEGFEAFEKFIKNY